MSYMSTNQKSLTKVGHMPTKQTEASSWEMLCVNLIAAYKTNVQIPQSPCSWGI